MTGGGVRAYLQTLEQAVGHRFLVAGAVGFPVFERVARRWEDQEVKGTAERVRRDQESGKTVLRFVLAKPDGSRVAVEMRGEEIRGVLDEGDPVVFDAGPRDVTIDGVQRPLRLRNESTGSFVVAWQRPWLVRTLKPFSVMLASALISSGVTIFLTGLGGIRGSNAEPAFPGASGDEGSHVPLVVVLFLTGLYWAIWFGSYGRRWRAKGRPIWPVLLGLFVGVAGPAAFIVV
jgi:hypothetical protein